MIRASLPRLGSMIAIVAAGVALGVLLLGGAKDNSYVVYAKFKDAAGLLPNFFVKINEVRAGTVQTITLDRNDNAVVKMVLDRSAAPIGPGASAQVRPVNLLGEKYVDLLPGDQAHPLPSGSVIPQSRTGAPVELDDIFNTLNPSTRTSLGLLINEAGLAVAGRGTDLMATLHDLPSALDAARRVVGEVAADNGALATTITAGNRALAAVTAKRADFNRLVDEGAAALHTLAVSDTNLAGTVDRAPAALAQLRTTLGQLQAMARSLQPAAADLQTTAPALATTLGRIPAFTTSADAALTEARSVAPALNRLAVDSTPLLGRLRPTLANVSSFTTTVNPLLTGLDTGNGLREVLGFAAGWQQVTKTRDGLGHIFRLHPTIDSQALTNVLNRYAAANGINLGPAHRRSAPRHTAPLTTSLRAAKLPAVKLPAVPTVKLPPLPLAPLTSTLAAATQKVTGLVTKATGGLGAVTPPSGGAQAPPASSTANLLHYLLGR